MIFSWIFICFTYNKKKKKQFKNANSHHSCPNASIAIYRNAIKFILHKKKKTKPFSFIYTVTQKHRWSMLYVQYVSNSSNLSNKIYHIVKWSWLREQSFNFYTIYIRSICNDGFQKSFATTIPWNYNQQSKQLYHKRTEISMPAWWHSGLISCCYFVRL